MRLLEVFQIAAKPEGPILAVPQDSANLLSVGDVYNNCHEGLKSSALARSIHYGVNCLTRHGNHASPPQ
jgi:hypothetical protein